MTCRAISVRLQLWDLRDALAAFLTSAPGIGRADGMAPQGAEAVATLLELATHETGMLGRAFHSCQSVQSFQSFQSVQSFQSF